LANLGIQAVRKQPRARVLPLRRRLERELRELDNRLDHYEIVENYTDDIIEQRRLRVRQLQQKKIDLEQEILFHQAREAENQAA
jgi:hypothetical protein